MGATLSHNHVCFPPPSHERVPGLLWKRGLRPPSLLRTMSAPSSCGFAVFDLLVLRIGLLDRNELLHLLNDHVKFEFDASLVQIHRQDPRHTVMGINIVGHPVVKFQVFLLYAAFVG